MRRSFSVRHLLSLVALVAIAVAICTSIRNDFVRERFAVARIEATGGEVTQDAVGFLPSLLGDRATAVELHSLASESPRGADYNPIDDLRHLPELRSLSVSPFVVKDDDLRGLEHVSRDLCELRISGNGFSGSVMSIATRFKKLEVLTLDHVEVSGSDLKKLEVFPRLRTLELSSISITDRDLPFIGKIASLHTLKLSSTSIKGDSLKSLENLTQLEMLKISAPAPLDADTQEMIDLLKSMRSGADAEAEESESGESGHQLRFDDLPILPSMRTLIAGGCTFDSRALAIIGRQPALSELILSYGKFPADLSTTDIGNWKIKTLTFKRCERTADLILEASKISSLQSISIDDPQIGLGDLAPLASLPRLETVVLAGVQNDGQIGVFRDFPAIDALYFWGTKLSPADRNALPKLERLQVYDSMAPPWD